MTRTAVVAVVLGLACALIACGETGDKMKEKAGEAAKAAGEAAQLAGEWTAEKWGEFKDLAYEQKDEFLEKAKPMWETARTKLGEAREKAAAMGADTAAKFDDEMAVVKEKWTALQNASAEEWADAKKAFAEAVEAAKAKWEEATK